MIKLPNKILLTTFFFILLAGSSLDFFDIAWGTGDRLGKFSLTWAILFSVFCSFCLFLFIVLARIIWQDVIFVNITGKLIVVRQRLKWRRWLLLAAPLFVSIWFLQFSVFGIVFQGLYLRLSVWTLEIFLVAYLCTSESNQLINWKVFLFILVITASLFSIMAALNSVTDYPFSLGWSEGNRLWDYSMLFGRGRYDFPDGQKINVFLDIGRQVVGGLPFLFPGITIKMERMWIGFMSIFPYIFLGMVAFRSFIRERYIMWLALSLWAFLFLNQGPIHPPLILCALLVVLAWRSNLWFSFPLVIFATYAAYISRFTWTFAPGIWFFVLEFIDSSSNGKNELDLTPRIRFLLMGLFFGVIGVLTLFGVGNYLHYDYEWAGRISVFFSNLRINPRYIIEKISQQPLLWYRLLPNKTYGNGILVGLIFAVFPLILVLFYLHISGKWKTNIWQRWALLLPMLAFFVVGIIVSVKIGGGGDLHNMDMFLIGLFFMTVVVLCSGPRNWLNTTQFSPLWLQVVLVLLIIIPALGPLKEIRSYDFGGATSWLVTLTDAPNERSLGMYPSDRVIDSSLSTIQGQVDLAKKTGDVLFADQRQLLTFGFIKNVPLIPEYDKKILIEKSLTNDSVYFEKFYKDLTMKRFTLIITQPIATPKKGSDYQFGEENNAWVKWVANPLLCFYKVKQTLLDVNVQLLIPKQGKNDCTKVLP